MQRWADFAHTPPVNWQLTRFDGKPPISIHPLVSEGCVICHLNQPGNREWSESQAKLDIAGHPNISLAYLIRGKLLKFISCQKVQLTTSPLTTSPLTPAVFPHCDWPFPLRPLLHQLFLFFSRKVIFAANRLAVMSLDLPHPPCLGQV